VNRSLTVPLPRLRPIATLSRLLAPHRLLRGLAAGIGTLAAILALHLLFHSGAEPQLALLTLTPAVLLAGMAGGTGAAIAVVALAIPASNLVTGAAADGLATFAFAATTLGGAALLDHLTGRLQRQQALAQHRDRELARQRMMQAELQHRVANSMQFASGLLAMQARKPGTGSETRDALGEAGRRLGRMARLHRLLQDPAAAVLPLPVLIEEICSDILYGAGAEHLRCEIQVEPVILSPARLTSLALLVAEALANALKHAAADGRAGCVGIALRRHRDMLELTVADDGPGWPADFVPERSLGLGMRVMGSLARQLGGELVFETRGGAVLRLAFPAETREERVSPAGRDRPRPAGAASAPRPASGRISGRPTAECRSA
jgi:two-component sensor histidine kinase